MAQHGSRIWRMMFVIAGMLYLAGGALHPRGEMVEMLADPVWLAGHSASLAGLVALLTGLVMFRRSRQSSPAFDRWLGFGVIVTALEAIEMAVHAVAYVDAHALAAGHSTPVFTTHMWLATLIYPIFGVVMLGLIWTAQRERSLGSPWINWIGMVGAAAHGIVMPLIFLLDYMPARVLFPIAALTLSVWFILAGLWPVRSVAASGMSAGGRFATTM